MGLPVQEAVCTECSATIETQPKRSFLGFRKFQCASCNKTFLYPLTPGYKALYWVALILFGVLAVGLLLTGRVALPGILVIAAIAALVKDTGIRRKVAVAESAGQPSAFPPEKPTGE